MNENTKLLIGILSFFKFVFFALLLIGTAFYIDGVKIIVNHSDYKAGVLRIDSLGVTNIDLQDPTIMGYGSVNAVHTGIVLGIAREAGVNDVMSDLHKGVPVIVPVWYKSDGELTIDRFPEEKEFPLERIYTKLSYYFFLFFGPFLVVLIWQIKLKRRLKREKIS